MVEMHFPPIEVTNDAMQSVFENIAVSKGIEPAEVGRFLIDHESTEITERMALIQALGDAIAHEPIPMQELETRLGESFLIGGHASSRSQVRAYLANAAAAAQVKSLVRGAHTAAEIDDFINAAIDSGIADKDGIPGRALAALLASFLLAAATDGEFVDYRLGRWTYGARLFELGELPRQKGYGARIKWTAAAAAHLASCPAFRSQFDRAGIVGTVAAAGMVHLIHAQLKQAAEIGIPSENDRSELLAIAAFEARVTEQVPGTTEANAVVKARIGQSGFRRKLLQLWQGQCAVSACSEQALLVASHIHPWHLADPEQRLDPFNGLLLSPGYDRAFDHGLISFADDRRILIFEPARQDLAAIGITENDRLRKLFDRHRPYLALHRQRWRGAVPGTGGDAR